MGAELSVDETHFLSLFFAKYFLFSTSTYNMSLYETVRLTSENGLSFRLIDVTFGRDETGIPFCGTLKTYALCDAPLYEALSYTWGTAPRSLPILLNEQECYISPTLQKALVQLLKQDGNSSRPISRRLWIDAICINQNDDAEKSTQVSQMKEIYAQACRVLVWLGPGDDKSLLALDTLSRFATDDGTTNGSKTYNQLASNRPERISALQQMVQKAWFSRVWVIQEVVVAREVHVHCGHVMVNWDVVNTGIKRATGSGYYPFSSQVYDITTIGKWRKKFHQQNDLILRDEALDLNITIMSAGEKGATDLRDKVYAIRGIASNGFAKGITVDYQCPTERVYIDCAKHLLRMRQDLRVLSLVRQCHKKEFVDPLPTWVPNWNRGISGGVFNRYYRFLPEKLFRAAHTTRSKVLVSSETDDITVSGIRLDRIQVIFKIETLLREPQKTAMSFSKQLLCKLAPKLTPSIHYLNTSEPTWMALFRTLTADRTALSPRINDTYRSKYFSNLKSQNRTLDDDDSPILKSAWDQLAAWPESSFNGKVLFLTNDGFLGLTEDGCQVGDIVCIFLGGEVPFVIREDPHHGPSSFHGEAYVHGVMDGEVLTANPLKDIEHFRIK
ncbi:heterokaryon incompatibility protein-domain-containing protein [Whalleya microplaca]|nr:heterokaryon incompatibility protein-domain-containing protein [Whalleya microplaca]